MDSKKKETEDIETIEEIGDQLPHEVLKATAAKQIASYLIKGYIILIALPFFYIMTIAIITNANVVTLQTAFTETIEWVTTVSAVLGGIIGAVTMYYFTSGRE